MLILSHWQVLFVVCLQIVSVFVFAQVATSVVMLIPHLRALSAKQDVVNAFLLLFSSICYIFIQIDITLFERIESASFAHEILRKSGEILLGVILIRYMNNRRCLYCRFLKKNYHDPLEKTLGKDL